MRNKVVKKLLMIAMAVTMISGTSLATVYANANPPAEETMTAVVEETTTEKSKDTEKAEDTGRVTGESNNSGANTVFAGIGISALMIRKMMIQNSSLLSRRKRGILFTWSLTVPVIQRTCI